jgi:transposase
MMPNPVQVWCAVEAVDMRMGMDGLSLRVQQALGKAPCDGSAYAFRNRRHNRLKLLVWDSTGVWLCQRRLHSGSFVWPQAGDVVCPLGAAQWEWLIAGVDWQRLGAPQARNWSL